MVKLHFHPENAPSVKIVFLCDTGASVNCLNERMVAQSGLRIFPSSCNPVGATGAALTNKGDIYGIVEFSTGRSYRDRFTLIEDLPFQGIIGINFLQSNSFQLLEDGTSVLFNKEIEKTVSGSDFIMTNQDKATMISCVTEFLEPPQKGRRNVIQNDSKMNTCYETDHLNNSVIPDKVNDKPRIEMMDSKLTSSREVSKERKEEEERTQSGYVGVSTSSDTVLSNADTTSATHNNLKSLMNATNLPKEMHRSLCALLLKNQAVFSRHDEDLGCFRSTDGGPSKVTFEVRDPKVFVHSIPRRVPYERRKWLIDKLKAMEKSGIIEEVKYTNTSLQVSPIVIVPKKQGKFRLAVDYREINKNIKPSTMPLPNIKDCIECLAKKKFFSALDVTSAFNQVQLTEQTKDLLGFVTMNKRYRTNVMPFGVNSCPGEFQNVISRSLRNVPKDYITIYLDDILIHTVGFQEHLVILEKVFRELQRHGLKLNPLKCSLAQNKLEYLGFEIGLLQNGKNGYRPLDKKIEAIRDCPEPTSPKEVRQFTGSLQFYNNLIENLNLMLTPLHRGSAKKPFVMTEEMINAFNAVKARLADEISLAFPDFTLPFTLTTDASFAGASGILTQDRDGDREIIYTFSKAFNDVESRWAIIELELLAFVWSLEKMRTLLLGRHFTWITDSLVLKKMIEKPMTKDMSRSGRKISRFLEFINEFDFDCVHIKGDQPETQMADFLSRAPVVAIENFFRIQLTQDEWLKAVQSDEDLMQMRGPWQKYSKIAFDSEGLKFVEKQPRAKLAVPKTLQAKVIEYYHNTYTIHGGVHRVIQLITPYFIWPGMHADIRNFIAACKDCNFSKTKPPQKGVFTEIEVPKKPMEWIQIDLVVLKSPKNRSQCQYILTAICTLTNYFLMQPLVRKTGPDIIKALGNIFCVGGVPRIIQSDNGREFKNEVVQTHSKWLNIEWRFVTPYKPSSNGRIERKHAELGKLLRLQNLDYDRIEEELPYLQIELNSAPDQITQYSPFECFHGWSPNIPHVLKNFPIGSHELSPTDLSGEIDKLSWEESLRTTQTRTFDAIREQRTIAKNQQATKQTVTTQLVPGDLVMVKEQTPSKLTNRAKGPYEVIRVNRGGTVHVKNPENDKISRLPPDLVVRYRPIKANISDNQICGSEEQYFENTNTEDEEEIHEGKPELRRSERLRKKSASNFSKYF